jgi:hypothetical protein
MGVMTTKEKNRVFKVQYIRQGKMNQWKARTEDQGQETNKGEGVMGSFTARWKEQTEANENHATLSISIQTDPRYFEMSPEFEEARRTMLEKVNRTADQEFLKRHPDAHIDHGEV